MFTVAVTMTPHLLQDFVEMFVHHIATVALMSFSYVGNFIRVGCLVLMIHDCADFWVEVGATVVWFLVDFPLDKAINTRKQEIVGMDSSTTVNHDHL